MFRFPSDPGLRHKWLDNMRKPRHTKINDKATTGANFICARHFNMDQFLPPDGILKSSRNKHIKTKKHLTKDAVPTLFGFTEETQPWHVLEVLNGRSLYKVPSFSLVPPSENFVSRDHNYTGPMDDELAAHHGGYLQDDNESPGIVRSNGIRLLDVCTIEGEFDKLQRRVREQQSQINELTAMLLKIFNVDQLEFLSARRTHVTWTQPTMKKCDTILKKIGHSSYNYLRERHMYPFPSTKAIQTFHENNRKEAERETRLPMEIPIAAPYLIIPKLSNRLFLKYIHTVPPTKRKAKKRKVGVESIEEGDGALHRKTIREHERKMRVLTIRAKRGMISEEDAQSQIEEIKKAFPELKKSRFAKRKRKKKKAEIAPEVDHEEDPLATGGGSEV